MQIYIFIVALSLVILFSFMDSNSGKDTEIDIVITTSPEVISNPVYPVKTVELNPELTDNSNKVWIDNFTKASIRSNVSDARKIVGIPKGIPLHILHGWAVAHVLAFNGFTDEEKIRFCAEMSIEVLDNENIESDNLKSRLKQMIGRYEDLKNGENK